MSELGIPAKLIRFCRMKLSNSCSSAKAGKDPSERFATVEGFTQNDPYSYDLLNFVMDSVLRKAGVIQYCIMPIFYKSVQHRHLWAYEVRCHHSS